MSIRQAWKLHIGNNELFKLGFLVPGPPEKRVVLLSPELNTLISGPWPHNSAAERCARLRADLENILAGNPLVVCWQPYKAGRHHQIGRLEPIEDNIFDIRSIDPSPGLRVLFHFAEKDVLVLHVCNPRSLGVSWLSRLPLGGRSSKAWRRAIAESKERWSILFPKYEPHKGDTIDDYLSNAVLS
jgi:hypothetical protein